MKVLTYSQRDGFADHEFEINMAAGEVLSDWIARAGFETSSSEGEGYEPENRFDVHFRGAEARHSWEALVIVDSSCRWDPVLVATMADLMALRLALAPFVLLNLLDHQQELERIARLAFHAMHGHSAEGFCSECDPEQTLQWDKAQKKKGGAV